MPWSVSFDNAAGSVTLTPDSNTTSEDLKDLLDQAIAAGATSVIKHADQFYEVNILDQEGIGSNTATAGLFFAGITVLVQDRWYRRDGSTTIATSFDKNGDHIGFPTLLLNDSGGGFFPNSATWSTGGNSNNRARTIANGLLVQHINITGGNQGPIIGGPGTKTNSSYKNCTFTSLEDLGTNTIFYIDEGPLEDCRFFRIPAIELTADTLLKGLIFESCGRVKNNTTDTFLEGCSFQNTAYNIVGSSNRRTRLFDCDLEPEGVGLDGPGVTGRVEAYQSLEIQGSANSAGGLVFITDPIDTRAYARTLDGSGNIQGGNEKDDVDNEDSASSTRLLLRAWRNIDGTLAVDYRGEAALGIAKYGLLPYSTTIDIVGNELTGTVLPVLMLTDDLLQADQSTAAAYAGVAIAYATETLTITEARTKQELYDWLSAQKASLQATGVLQGSIDLPQSFFPTPGQRYYELDTGTFRAQTLAIASTGSLSGAEPLNVTGTVELQAAGDHSSAAITVTSTGVVLVADGVTDLSTWVFQSGAQVNLLTGATAATVRVSSTAFAVLTAGPGVTLEQPIFSLSIPDFVDTQLDTRVAVIREEFFTVDAATAISTGTGDIELASNRFTATSPVTLVAFIPQGVVTAPQLDDGSSVEPLGLYAAQALDGDRVTLSKADGGQPLAFTSTGSGTYLVIGFTEIYNAVTAAGSPSGPVIPIQEPSGSTLLVKARQWGVIDGTARASEYFIRDIVWSGADQAISGSLARDEIHEEITAASEYTADGSAVTGIVFDLGGTVQFDFSGDATRKVQDFYAWHVWHTFTEDGIRQVSDLFQAQDAANFLLSPPVKLENVNAGTTVTIAGGYLRRTDGEPLTFFGPSSGNIEYRLAPGQLVQPFTVVSGSGLDSGQAAELTAIATRTARVDGLLEDPGDGDRFTAAALAEAAVADLGPTNTAISNLPQTKDGYTLSAAGVTAVATGVWGALTTGFTVAGSVGKRVLDNLNAAVSSRLAAADYTPPDYSSTLAAIANLPQDKTGYSLTTASQEAIATAVWSATTRALTDKSGFGLSASERGLLAVAIEEAIINEGDGRQVVDAIVNLINANLDLPALELAAIASQVRSELAGELQAILDALTAAQSVDTKLSTSRLGYIDSLATPALFKATGFSTHSATDVLAVLQSRLTAIDDAIASTQASQPDVGPLQADIATLLGRASEQRLAKLDVAGDLAHAGNAATFKATGFSTHSAADVTGVLQLELDAIALAVGLIPTTPALANDARLDRIADLATPADLQVTVTGGFEASDRRWLRFAALPYSLASGESIQELDPKPGVPGYLVAEVNGETVSIALTKAADDQPVLIALQGGA